MRINATRHDSGIVAGRIELQRAKQRTRGRRITEHHITEHRGKVALAKTYRRLDERDARIALADGAAVLVRMANRSAGQIALYGPYDGTSRKPYRALVRAVRRGRATQVLEAALRFDPTLVTKWYRSPASVHAPAAGADAQGETA